MAAQHGLYTTCNLCCLLLQSYIDFEISEGNREHTRKLYERLLQRTRHVKVSSTFALLRHASVLHFSSGLPA